MTEVLASRSFRGLAAEDAIESVHNDLDSLWLDVPFVQDMDQMTFTTAVIESASNIVQHAEPAGQEAGGARRGHQLSSPRCCRPGSVPTTPSPRSGPWNRQHRTRTPSPAGAWR